MKFIFSCLFVLFGLTLVLSYDKIDTKSLKIPGNYTIGAIGILHNFITTGYAQCGEIQPTYAVLAEAFNWMIKQSNIFFKERHHSFTFGAWLKDSCDNAVVGMKQLVQMMADMKSNGICNGIQDRESDTIPIGITGAFRIAPFLEVFCVPLVSAYSTEDGLQNKDVYPYLLSETPPDYYETLAMYKLLKEMKWTLVTVIFEDTLYGRNLFNQFLIHQTTRIRQSGTEVLLLLTDISVGLDFMSHLKAELKLLGENLSKFQLIVPDAISRFKQFFTKYPDSANHAISFEPLNYVQPDFEKYIKNLNGSEIEKSNNPWLPELFEYDYDCTFNKSNFKKRPCPMNAKFSSNILTAGALARSTFVIEAVMAYRNAFDILCSKETGCNFNGSTLLKTLRNIQFNVTTSTGKKRFRFLSGKEVPEVPTYAIYQTIKSDCMDSAPQHCDIKFVNVGLFYVNSTTNESQLVLNDDRKHPIKPPINNKSIEESIENCMQMGCPVGYRKFPSKQKKCCSVCEKCSPSSIVVENSFGDEVCQLCSPGTYPGKGRKECKDNFPSVFDCIVQVSWTIFTLAFVGLLTTLFCIGSMLYYWKSLLVSERLPWHTLIHCLCNGIILLLSTVAAFGITPTQAFCIIWWSSNSICFSVMIFIQCIRFLHFFNVFQINYSYGPRIGYTVIGMTQLSVFLGWFILQFSEQKTLSYGQCSDENTATIAYCSGFYEPVTLAMFLIPVVLLLFLGISSVKVKAIVAVQRLEARITAVTSFTLLLLIVISLTVIYVDLSTVNEAVAPLVVMLFVGYCSASMHLPAVIMMFKKKYQTKAYLWSYREGPFYKQLLSNEIHKEILIGSGHYGEVWKAVINSNHSYDFKMKDVAIKILKDNASDADERDFRDEALILSHINSDHIVKLLGICMEQPMMLVMEYMNSRSLKAYLKNKYHTKKPHRPFKYLMGLTMQCIDACMYLESVGYIHRDISLKNFLVKDVNERGKNLCVKLGDFGKAKDVKTMKQFTMSTNEELPAAWTSAEAFLGEFTHQSDIYSLGVTIWEIFSWGSDPYGHCSINHTCTLPKFGTQEIIRKIMRHETLFDLKDQPCNADFSKFPLVQQAILMCWYKQASVRPTAEQLQHHMELILRTVSEPSEEPSNHSDLPNLNSDTNAIPIIDPKATSIKAQSYAEMRSEGEPSRKTSYSKSVLELNVRTEVNFPQSSHGFCQS